MTNKTYRGLLVALLALGCSDAKSTGSSSDVPTATGGALSASGGITGDGGGDPLGPTGGALPSSGGSSDGGTGGAAIGTGGSGTGGTVSTGATGGADATGGLEGTGGVQNSMIWLPSWATSMQGYESSKADHQPPIALSGNTLRQFVYPTFDGTEVRIQLSNIKGEGPLDIEKVHIAQPSTAGGIDVTSDVPFTFSGAEGVTIPAGQTVISDDVSFGLERGTLVALSIQFGQAVPAELTTHPGARTTSYFAAGDSVSSSTIENQTRERWYFIEALEVLAPAGSGAIACLGDSITDGYGVVNAFERWTDALTIAIGADPTLSDQISVLNFGVGANQLTQSSEDQDAGRLRFTRDVLSRDTIKWLILLEGVNDINANVQAEPIIDAYQEIISAAQTAGIKVYISPITPLGSDNAVRNGVNTWIRTHGTDGTFSGVIDFDAVLRDAQNPHVLAMPYRRDDGDMLHPSLSGYAAMGASVDLDLFR